jgi:hypothetical protein
MSAAFVLGAFVFGAMGATATASTEIGGITGGANGCIVKFIHITVELFNDLVSVDDTVKEFLADR